jgi:hypothetical protein
MAGSNKYAYYSNSALETTFLKIKLSIQIGLMLLREQVSILKIIYLFLDHRKILNIFQFRKYEEKAVLNGLDFNRTTFRNNNEYKISKKITLNQNFSFGLTNSNPKPLNAFTNAYKQSPIVPVRFQQDNMEYLCADGFAGTTDLL